MQRIRQPQITHGMIAFVVLMALLCSSALGITGHSAFFFDFANGGGDDAGLTIDASGNIWGISAVGGAYGYGNVFQLTHNANGQLTQTVLYSFTGGIDGGTPIDKDGPLIDSEGNLYGTTFGGGTYNDGTVFKLTRGSSGWEENVLWNFTCGNDGCGPEASLVFDSAGNLYGTTYEGGPNVSGSGTVFQMSPDGRGNWNETTLHVFTGLPDGSGPLSSLIIDQSGNIFGTTSAGGYYVVTYGCNYSGLFGCGVVFKLSKKASGDWTEQVLYAFKGGHDGAYPFSRLVRDASGNLYGVTYFAGDSLCFDAGCGTVFRLAPPKSSGSPWSLTSLHIFSGGNDGGQPDTIMLGDITGAVYGTTFAGGKGQCGLEFTPGCGTVYRLAPKIQGSWTFELLYSFTGKSDGGVPSSITFAGSTAYVATGAGGLYGIGGVCPFGTCGTIFELSSASKLQESLTSDSVPLVSTR